MKSNLISKSETAQMLKEISRQWRMQTPKIKNLKMYQIEDNSAIITGDGLTVLKINSTFLPFLSDVETLIKFPSVMVDMGAVKFMCNGANVMRPGIRKFANFEKGDIVCIVEESQGKFLAVGRALVSSSDLDTMNRGVVIENLHYISDKYWEIKKSLKD